jgi:hypothetical protein
MRHELGRGRDIAMIGGNEPPRAGQVPSPPGPATPLITAMQVFLDRRDSDVVDFEPATEQLAAIDALDTGVRADRNRSITLEAFDRDIPEA